MILTTAIPVYNGAKTITRALTSLYTSEKQPDRVVVLDDGSTDHTLKILEEFKYRTGWEALEWMRFTNAGYVGNSNRAIQLAAETDYLHILHADDEVGRYFYTKAVPALRRDIGMAFSQPLIWNDETHQVQYVKGERRSHKPERFIKTRRDLGHIYYCGTLLRTMRKDLCMRFDERFPQVCDQVFWAQWARYCPEVVELDPYLTTYHVHNQSWTANQKKDLPKQVREEWEAMGQVDQDLRNWYFWGTRTGQMKRSRIGKLRSKCLLACRSVVKANGVRNTFYGHGSDILVMDYHQKASEIDRACIECVGWLPWMLGKMVVWLREHLP